MKDSYDIKRGRIAMMRGTERKKIFVSINQSYNLSDALFKCDLYCVLIAVTWRNVPINGMFL